MFYSETVTGRIKYICVTARDVIDTNKKRACWINVDEIQMVEEVDGGSCITLAEGTRKYVTETPESIMKGIVGKK